MSPLFLSVEDILDLHARQLARYGGGAGLRDAGLLASATAQPSATFDGEYLHADLFEMAAAYHFFLVRDHPFVDGNKRVALLAALVFLDLNGIEIVSGTDRLYEITMAAARGEANKEELADSLRQLAGVTP